MYILSIVSYLWTCVLCLPTSAYNVAITPPQRLQKLPLGEMCKIIIAFIKEHNIRPAEFLDYILPYKMSCDIPIFIIIIMNNIAQYLLQIKDDNQARITLKQNNDVAQNMPIDSKKRICIEIMGESYIWYLHQLAECKKEYIHKWAEDACNKDEIKKIIKKIEHDYHTEVISGKVWRISKNVKPMLDKYMHSKCTKAQIQVMIRDKIVPLLSDPIVIIDSEHSIYYTSLDPDDVTDRTIFEVLKKHGYSNISTYCNKYIKVSYDKYDYIIWIDKVQERDFKKFPVTWYEIAFASIPLENAFYEFIMESYNKLPSEEEIKQVYDVLQENKYSEEEIKQIFKILRISSIER